MVWQMRWYDGEMVEVLVDEFEKMNLYGTLLNGIRTGMLEGRRISNQNWNYNLF